MPKNVWLPLLGGTRIFKVPLFFVTLKMRDKGRHAKNFAENGRHIKNLSKLSVPSLPSFNRRFSVDLLVMVDTADPQLSTLSYSWLLASRMTRTLMLFRLTSRAARNQEISLINEKTGRAALNEIPPRQSARPAVG